MIPSKELVDILPSRTPLISVVIDTYNNGRFIKDSIDSVLSQTVSRKSFEIIVIDDGSTDDTEQKVAQYKDKIIYFRKENGGQASALNAGFRLAKGKIIALLDSDDFWEPDNLEGITEAFEHSKSVDAAYHFANIVNKAGWVISKLPANAVACKKSFEKYPKENYLKGIIPFAPPTSGFVIRMECLQKIIPIPVEFRVCADIYLGFLLPLYAREFALIPRYSVNYRSHENNLWKGREAASRFAVKIKLHSLINRSVRRRLLNLGYESGGLNEKLESFVEWFNILQTNLEGHKLQALLKTLSFNEFVDSSMRGPAALRKMFRLFFVLLPYPVSVWLKNRFTMI